jgi:hypothetical protein
VASARLRFTFALPDPDPVRQSEVFRTSLEMSRWGMPTASTWSAWTSTTPPASDGAPTPSSRRAWSSRRPSASRSGSPSPWASATGPSSTPRWAVTSTGEAPSWTSSSTCSSRHGSESRSSTTASGSPSTLRGPRRGHRRGHRDRLRRRGVDGGDVRPHARGSREAIAADEAALMDRPATRVLIVRETGVSDLPAEATGGSSLGDATARGTGSTRTGRRRLPSVAP